MIYDCFTFFNELDLLEIRLHELNDVVDKFVIVEATKTFSNKNKPLFFDLNKQRFHQFLPKIIHVVVDDFNLAESILDTPFFQQTKKLTSQNIDTWTKEVYQRNCILRGLDKCNDNDIILISDIDEIPNKTTFNQLKNLTKIKAFEMKNYYFYFNFQGGDNINCARAVLKKNLTTPQEIRFSPDFDIIKNGGWHFSYLGGIKNIQNKISSFSHQELNTKQYTDYKRLKFNIDNGFDIFDRHFHFKILQNINWLPVYLQKNKRKYIKYFKRQQKQSPNTIMLINEVISLREKNLKIQQEFQNRESNYLETISKLNNDLSTALNELSIITSSKLYKLFPLYEKIKLIIKSFKLSK